MSVANPSIDSPTGGVSSTTTETALQPFVAAPPAMLLGAATISNYMGQPYNPYGMTSVRDSYSYSETAFYSDYDESYRVNPYTTMVVENFITTFFADGFHFEGEGADEVEAFFVQDRTRNKLEMFMRDAVRKGNGIMDQWVNPVTGKLHHTTVVDPGLVLIDMDIDGNSPTYGERRYFQGNRQLNERQLWHFMLRELSGVAYGVSLLRSNLLFLQAIYDADGDVLAALKRTAYAPIVTKLDLENYRTEDEKRAVVNAFEDRLKDVQSATQNFVIDKRHDVNLMGVGSAGARLLPTNDMLEPIIAVVLQNFGFPIGAFLQGGANKSIVDNQRENVRAFFESFRRRFVFDMETNLLPKITKKKTRVVFNRPPPSTTQTQEEMKTMAVLYQAQLISREHFCKQFGIVDEGKTFFEGNISQGSSHDLKGNPGNKTGVTTHE